jgi:quercetin 2,3-dioxygenase
MTNLLSTLAPIDETTTSASAPVVQALTPRTVPLTDDLTVERALPQRERRLVGPWCFLDHFRTHESESDRVLDVLPHPHIGLQTVTWLFDGAVRHRDSLGNDRRITPGQLNIMTAGRGIVHAERSLPEAASLHGLQLWVALPDAHRDVTPSFEHHADLPVLEIGGVTARVLAGTFAQQQSPATIYSPLVGIEISAPRGGRPGLPLDPVFEHAVLIIEGAVAMGGNAAGAGTLLYLGASRTQMNVEMSKGTRLFLFGGVPLREHVMLWWNFVAHSNDDMVQAREQWEQHAARFPDVPGYNGQRFPAPPLLLHLRG